MKGFEFRQYSFQRKKFYVRFHFLGKDEVQRTFFVNIYEFQENNSIDLTKIIKSLSQKGLIIQGYKFLISQTNYLIDTQLPNWINLNSFQYQDLILYMVDKSFSLSELSKLNKLENESVLNLNNVKFIQTLELSHQTNLPQTLPKRVKQPERLINQVIQKVKYWRQLHQIDGFSLRDSAKIVGVSKKSLDDYYLLLRNGEYNGFDFIANFQHGIGRLRAFIRRNNFRNEGRLPKEIKNYKLFSLIKQQEKFLDTEVQDSLYNYKIDNSQ